MRLGPGERLFCGVIERGLRGGERIGIRIGDLGR